MSESSSTSELPISTEISTNETEVTTEMIAIDHGPTETSKMISIDDYLPIEIIFIIMEGLDALSLMTCMFVSSRWKEIAERVANDQNKWKSVLECLNFRENLSDKSKDLDWKEQLKIACYWNYYQKTDKTTDEIKVGSFPEASCKKLFIYKDKIIVITQCKKIVKYYNANTFALIRAYETENCADIIENDHIFVIETEQISGKRIGLFGKCDPDDCLPIEPKKINGHQTILKLFCVNYCVEGNSCYTFDTKTVLTRHYYDEGWKRDLLGRYHGAYGQYGPMKSLHNRPPGICSCNGEMYIMFHCGQIFACAIHSGTRTLERVVSVGVPFTFTFFRIFHSFCVVFGVPGKPDEYDEFLTTHRAGNGCVFYKLICPNLSCVAEFGKVVILGYGNGKIDFFMPSAKEQDRLKRRIYLNDIDNELVTPCSIASIDVFEELGTHHVYIVTSHKLYHLKLSHPDEEELWNNPPEVLPLPIIQSYIRNVTYNNRNSVPC